MKNDFFVERSVCPICGSKDAICILSIPFDSDVMITYLKSFYNKQGGIRDFSIFNSVSYELMQCGCCSLIYQKFIPDDNLMYKLYEEFIDPEIKKREVFGGKVNLSNHNRLLSKEIEYLIKKVPEKKEPIKFLDYGMGWGLLCKVAISYKCDTYGTELSTSKIEYAKNNGVKVVLFEELEKYRFDIINLSDVLEHVSEPYLLIDKLKKVLTVNGIIRISVPWGNNVDQFLSMPLFSRELNSVAPLEHINCFSSESLRFLAKRLNMKAIGALDYIYYSTNENRNYMGRFKFFIKRNILHPYYYRISTNLMFKKI